MTSDSKNTPQPPSHTSLGKGKKTEMIEVRISYEAKQALQARAEKERRSVSKIVRHLIYEFLSPETETAPMPQTNLMSNLILFMKSWKTKIAIASAAISLPALFMIYPTAAAEQVTLMIDGNIERVVDENGINGINRRAFETNVITDYGNTVQFQPHSTIKVDLTVHDIKDEGIIPGNLVLVEIKLQDSFDSKNITISNPTLEVLLGETARIEVGCEGAESCTKYTFNLTPAALQP